MVTVNIPGGLRTLLSRVLNFLNHYIAKSHASRHTPMIIRSFDHIGLQINAFGQYEREVLLILEKIITKYVPEPTSCIALDVGANIGCHSLFFSQHFDTVYSIEPNPMTFDILSLNVKYHASSKIVPLNFALGLQNESKSFLDVFTNAGGSRIIKKTNEDLSDGELITVNVRNGDDVFHRDHNNIGLIKLDVEGYEYEALLGLEKTLQKNKPLILFEQMSDEIVSGASQSIDFLLKNEYRFFTLNRSYLFSSKISNKFDRILSYFLGYKIDCRYTTHFDVMDYDLIIAVPRQTENGMNSGT